MDHRPSTLPTRASAYPVDLVVPVSKSWNKRCNRFNWDVKSLTTLFSQNIIPTGRRGEVEVRILRGMCISRQIANNSAIIGASSGSSSNAPFLCDCVLSISVLRDSA